jgi:malonate-semialdehyde dehydrogenase (acetylating) / methylmalonate-semialdehyde dehydrogenase
LVRQPVGVVAGITPFNFPAMIPLWFLPYAIACGNTFILKPSERDPRPSERMFELIDSVDELPEGVLNLVHGAHDAVNGILDHPGIDAISFVGQASTARYIAERSAANGKRFQALGGAKNSLIVMPDADLDVTVPAIMSSAFGAGGQRCLAGSVAVLVGTRSEQDRALEALASAAAELGVGPGDEAGVEVCPLVGPDARERIEKAVAAAAEGDEEVVLDGRRDAGAGGSLIGPSIVETTQTESDLAREELFGPLLAVVRVDDLDGALEFANGSRYGNAGSIFTTSGGAARAYRWGAEAGMLGVNVGVAAPVAWFPFSGWKDSIDGDPHANGADAVEFYTRKKVVTSRW